MKDENITTLPKGTIVKVDGFPCELVQDTQVSGSIPAREDQTSLDSLTELADEPYDANQLLVS